jgi:hypothetical protein
MTGRVVELPLPFGVLIRFSKVNLHWGQVISSTGAERLRPGGRSTFRFWQRGSGTRVSSPCLWRDVRLHWRCQTPVPRPPARVLATLIRIGPGDLQVTWADALFWANLL